MKTHKIEFTQSQLEVIARIVADDVEAAAWNECDYSDPELMGYLKARAEVFQILKGLLK